MKSKALVGLISLTLVSGGCSAALFGTGGGGGGTSGGGQLSSSCRGDFGVSSAAQKLETFLLATATFVDAAAQLDTSLRDACQHMATDLAIPASELMPIDNQSPTQAICTRVAREIRETLSNARAAANVHVDVVAVPPVCEIELEARARCSAECSVQVTPGIAEIQCEGGEIRGRCEAQCTGRCAVEVQGTCGGRCDGSCSAGCTGICNGHCEGTCSSRGADGQCNGTCTGRCEGSCSAGCQGSCSGTCEVSGQASCSGECRGGCSVAYREPRCTGRVVPPRAEADCNAACDARFAAEARCTPGRASLNVTGGLTGDLQARVERVRTAINNSFGQILLVRTRLQRLSEAGGGMVRSFQGVPQALGELGLQAGACATAGIAAATRAVGSVSVSASVSVEVSASVTASAR